MKACIETDFEGLVVGFHAVLGAMERSDRFRIETVERQDLGAELNGPVEEQIARQWAFVADIRKALGPAGGNMEHFDGELGRTWARLKQGHADKPWITRFGRMEATARRMGIEQPLAQAA